MKLKLPAKMRFTFVLFLLGISIAVFSQTATVKGKVTDGQGNPVIGANVVVVGTATGTVTDIGGNYSLKVPVETKEISISFIGYLTETLKVSLSDGATQTLDITLAEDLMELEDVVVIGYGTMKKSDLTSAVASVSGEDLTSTTVSTVEQALQGRAAGVTISAVTGAPGANIQVNVRGVTSINNSNAAWIIDGVPGDPKSVNPNDVESIEILKDASSAAIYGSNGGNGVVLVTTKKGKAGLTSASLNITHGWQNVPKSTYLDVATGPEYGKMYTEYQRIMRTREDKILFPNYDTLPTYDYQSEVFQVAPMQNYDLGVSGGNDKSTFYMGLGYTAQDGVLRNSNYNKITVRINSEHKLNKWLKVGENVSLLRQVWGGFEEWQLLNEYHSPIMGAIQYQPFVPVYVNPDGSAAAAKNDTTNWSSTPIGNTANPVGRIELLHKSNENASMKATAFVIIEPIKGLRNETRLTGDISYGNNYAFTPEYFISPTNKSDKSSIYRGYNDYRGWQFQDYLTYSNSIANAHNFTIMGGFESGEGRSQNMGATNYDLLNETPNMWYFDAAMDDTSNASLPNGTAVESSGFGYFGRLNYDYKGIILGQVLMRHDENSKFGPKERKGNFPSYSVGIKFSEFNFVRNGLPFLNFGKIRYGYGEIGSNTLSDYSYYSTVRMLQVYDYSFDNTSTLSSGGAMAKLPNPSIHWEAVVTRNIGLDLGFLQNRLSITTEWFNRYNKGMIMQVEVPGHAGWIVRDIYQEGGSSLPYSNVGRMENGGFEFQATWKETKGKFSYSADLNFTYVTTIAKELPDTIIRGSITGLGGNLTMTVPNGALSEYYGYQTNGLFRPEDYDETLGVCTNQPYIEDPETGERIYAQPKAKPGDFRFKDINGDKKIDNKDIGPIGNPIPKYNYGLNLNFEYGWFDVNIFFQGAAGFKNFNANKIYMYSTDGAWNWSSEYINDHYRNDIYNRDGSELVFPANTTAKYPRIDPANANGNFSKESDFFMEDASYLRIKNFQLGMTLPKEWTRKVGVDELRLFVGGQNLYTFTKYTGYDPEVGSTDNLVRGLDKAAYPRARMLTVGGNFKF
jgi:TonB-dependent starch-binding outer membrane protein SusC